MKWYTLKPSLCGMLILWTYICCIQICWAGHRIVRSLNSSLEEIGPKNESSTEVPLCMNTTYLQSIHEELSKRSKRSSGEISSASAGNVDLSQLDEEFKNCMTFGMELGCYIILPNKSALVPMYHYRQFRPSQYYIDEQKVLNICPDFFDEYTSETKFSNTLAIVTNVGTAISFICILLHVGMFVAFKKLRNLPGYCLFSLCIALLVAYICTFTTSLGANCKSNAATGIIKAFAFLGSFFWMNVMSYDIWRSLRMATAKLRLTGAKPMLTRFAMYSAYAWGIPFFIIMVGVIVDKSSESNENYRLTMDEDSCWFKYRQALLVYFAIPLFSLLFCNIVLFISSFIMINSATIKKADNKADLWSRFLVSVRLAVVMGLMWIFGVLAAATEAMWLSYLNVCCNVFQGVFIFFSFTFNEKTRKACKKAIAKKKSSTMPTQVSSQQSSSV